MAGIYIHVPFCKQRCFYCDFYSETHIEKIPAFADALLKEINLRKTFISEKQIDTIYFGGGTPSVLESSQISLIINELYKHFEIADQVEITYEANPDDLTPIFLKELSETKVNRLSIGIQSFFDDDLQLMNRRHNAQQALKCIADAKKVGFSNISIDLIYGLPNLDVERWKQNLDNAFSLDIQHISAYHLTYEPNTVFQKLLSKGKINELHEDESIAQFDLLMKRCEKEKFVHYEISNFAKNGYFSKHNSNYWFQKQYLGLGPSAHSFNIQSRSWNVSSITQYIHKINEREDFFEHETLTKTDKYNDYILTRLRTMWGINLNFIEDVFGSTMAEFALPIAKHYKKNGLLNFANGHYFLSKKGKRIADSIISDFFYVED